MGIGRAVTTVGLLLSLAACGGSGNSQRNAEGNASNPLLPSNPSTAVPLGFTPGAVELGPDEIPLAKELPAQQGNFIDVDEPPTAIPLDFGAERVTMQGSKVYVVPVPVDPTLETRVKNENIEEVAPFDIQQFATDTFTKGYFTYLIAPDGTHLSTKVLEKGNCTLEEWVEAVKSFVQSNQRVITIASADYLTDEQIETYSKASVYVVKDTAYYMAQAYGSDRIYFGSVGKVAKNGQDAQMVVKQLTVQ